MSGDGLAETRFRPARFGRAGYDRAQVDAFVAEVRSAVRRGGATMAPYEVADKRFAVRRLATGYAMREVDEFLDRAEETLRERHGQDAVAAIPGHGSAPSRVAIWWVYAVAGVLVAVIAAVVVVAVR